MLKRRKRSVNVISREPKIRPKLSDRESRRVSALQLRKVKELQGSVFCCIVGQDISVPRCVGIQGQAECFGCAAPSRFCENCHIRLLAFPEVELCGHCLRAALEREREMGVPWFSKFTKVACPLAHGKIITVRACRVRQSAECGVCDAPSRICSVCMQRQVHYPEYGLCLHCTVDIYGGGWSARDVAQENEDDDEDAKKRVVISRKKVPHFYLSEKEVEEFLSVIDNPRDRALFGVIYHYGLRVAEVPLLRVQDVAADGTIFVRRVQSGIGGERPTPDALADLIKEYLAVRVPKGDSLFTGRQGSLTRSRIQQLFKRYAGRAGIARESSVYCLRRSLAVHLLDAGHHIEYVQRRLGHVNIQNTSSYARFSKSRASLLADML